MTRYIRPTLTRVGIFIATPAVFVVVLCYVAVWLAFDLETFDWHAVATIATLFMALLIQRTGHRDTQAIHAKLDELLRAEGQARNEMTQLDDEEPEIIEKHRADEAAKAAQLNSHQPPLVYL